MTLNNRSTPTTVMTVIIMAFKIDDCSQYESEISANKGNTEESTQQNGMKRSETAKIYSIVAYFFYRNSDH